MELVQLVDAGMSQHDIARELGVSQATVHRRLREAGLKTKARPGPTAYGSERACINPACSSMIGPNKRQRGWKYCSSACRRSHKIDQWETGEWNGAEPSGALSNYVHNHLIETRGEACEKCGWAEVHPTTGNVPIQIHHIDGTNNHTPGNLKILCPNCHSLTSNYCALNSISRKRNIHP